MEDWQRSGVELYHRAANSAYVSGNGFRDSYSSDIFSTRASMVRMRSIVNSAGANMPRSSRISLLQTPASSKWLPGSFFRSSARLNRWYKPMASRGSNPTGTESGTGTEIVTTASIKAQTMSACQRVRRRDPERKTPPRYPVRCTQCSTLHRTTILSTVRCSTWRRACVFPGHQRRFTTMAKVLKKRRLYPHVAKPGIKY